MALAPEIFPRWHPDDPFDHGPHPIGFAAWQPAPHHRPNYHDWLANNPDDFRDRTYPPELIDPRTGLPPLHAQGFEYKAGHVRHLNSRGGNGDHLHWNRSAVEGTRTLFDKKKRMAWVWPSDGKRKRTSGRWKDLFTASGPDIFVCRLGDRPSRNQWRNKWMDWTPEDDGGNAHVDMIWASRERIYDFRERRYRNAKGRDNGFWTDATWPAGGTDCSPYPLNWRGEGGEWHNLEWSPFGGIPMKGYTKELRRRRG